MRAHTRAKDVLLYVENMSRGLHLWVDFRVWAPGCLFLTMHARIHTGIPDAVEGSIDTDRDGLRDFEDADSDGDGILDEIECDDRNSTAAEGPPPDEANIVTCGTVQSNGPCKSLLNIRCADWRDKADTWTAYKQKDFIQQCMAQDCVQSLESGSDTPGCRFLDGQGFCYAYNSAQMWCANGGSSTYCHDGGADWGQPPLGTSTQAKTGWTPGTFPYRGSSADKGSLACACMKDCTCSRGTCWCVDEKQSPTGPGSFLPAKIHKSISKEGQCACVCNDVGARRRSLLAIDRPKRLSETVSLARILPGRDDVAPASPPPPVLPPRVCPDSDGDSIPDYLDTDSDNDGALYVVFLCVCGRIVGGRAGGRTVGQTGALACVCVRMGVRVGAMHQNVHMHTCTCVCEPAYECTCACRY